MKTNSEKLVKLSIQGGINHPRMNFPGYRVGQDGIARIVPATAGITYNFFIGDNCTGMIGDHVEPGVSSKNKDASENAAYATFACVGNEATVITGDAKGAKGIVTGKHGGADHVMLAFDEETLNKLTLNDQFLIKSFGTGLELCDYPEIKVMNLDPELLEKLPIKENDDHTLTVEVATVVPAYLMGSGLGVSTMQNGDYDIMMHDESANKEFGLYDLRFGDLVLIEDHKAINGPTYVSGAQTLGVVIHGDSYSAGHGPGVTVLMTSEKTMFKAVKSNKANLKDILDFKK